MSAYSTTPSDWKSLEKPHIGIALVFLLALALSALETLQVLIEALAGGILGVLLIALLFHVWGQRTRPRGSIGWALVIVAWLVVVLIVSFMKPIEGRTFFLAGLLVLPPALFARHDNGSAPTLYIAGGVWFALFATGRLTGLAVDRLGETDAVWVAVTSLLAITAATLEHERLARQEGPGTATAWVVMRLVFVSVWTLVIVSLREDVQWGRLFVLLGIDPSDDAGRIFMIGLMIAALAVAAYAFRPSRRRPPA